MKILNFDRPLEVNFILFLTFFSILGIDFCLKTQIHILEHPLNLRKENIQRTREKSLNNNDSLFSTICSSIYDTYYYLGEKSLKIYQNCREDYDLLGMLDADIVKNRPICFDNPYQFFCNYKITNHKKESCENIELIQLVLGILKGCLNVLIFKLGR
jgi:hypothetical protein